MLEILDLLSFLSLLGCIYLLNEKIKKLSITVDKQREQIKEHYDNEIYQMKVEHDLLVDSLTESQNTLYYRMIQRNKNLDKLNSISKLIKEEKAFTETWHSFILRKEELNNEILKLDSEINKLKMEIEK